MRKLLLTLALFLQLAAPVAAQSPVVVELFTSQGCDSCPPADAMLQELSGIPGVLPLAFHVDYWDYLGWKDDFASPELTARQYAYAASMGKRTVYTPQMIIAGESDVPGFDRPRVLEAVRMFQGVDPMVAISVDARPPARVIVAPLTADLPIADVVLVEFIDAADVAIKAGENRGRTVTYVNIVRRLLPLGKWQGREAAEFPLPPDGQGQRAVMVQASGLGSILGALALE